MRAWGRWSLYTLGALGGAVCLAAVMWTAWVLNRGNLGVSDAAGVLSFAPGVVGAVLGGWGVWLTVKGLRAAQSGTVIATRLATAVLETAGTQLKQLLGGDRQALNAPIDLAISCSHSSGVAGAADQGSLKNIVDYYRSVQPGRMVITGAPATSIREAGDAGVGKTVLAVALIVGLARNRRAADPVPVRLSAASWPGTTIPGWLVAHLVSSYNMPQREAETVVRERLVLPVIDGLDEMDHSITPGYASRAAQLLRHVEHYDKNGAKAPVVLTCRRTAYDALVDAEVQPQVVAQVEIAPVDPGRILAYLKDRVGYSERNLERWKPVLDAVTPGSSTMSLALTRALGSPWRLTLAAVVYEERDRVNGSFLRAPRDLIALADSGDLYKSLLDYYVKAVVNSPLEVQEVGTGEGGARVGVTLKPAIAWRRLSVLARYLNGNSASPPPVMAGRELPSTDLTLHDLWPLAGSRRVRIVGCAVTAILMIAFGAILLTYFAGGSGRWLFGAIMFAVMAAWATWGAWSQVWMEPQPMDIRQLRGKAGFRRFAKRLGVGMVLGVASGLILGLVGRPTLGFGLAFGLGFGVASGLALGVGLGLKVEKNHPVTDPRSLLFGDLTAWLVLGITLGVALAVLFVGKWVIVAGETQRSTPDAHGIANEAILSAVQLSVAGIAFGLALGLASGRYSPFSLGQRLGGATVVRYMAFLLCVRGRLPWRLGRFLNHCYELGLLRTAGTAYQFRHRELQNHLANHPTPPWEYESDPQ